MTSRKIASQAGVALLAAVLGVMQAWAESTPHQHAVVMNAETAAAATVVHQQAGPMLQDKMSKAVQQIEREVKTKGPFQGAGAHAMQQGVLLVAEDPDKVLVTQGARCPKQAPVRAYDVTAMNVEITVNRFGDFYPGYMYALTENVDGVREEEAKNKAARDSEDPTFAGGAVSNGLQGDLIQPLVIRANQGDCLRITLRNQIAEEPTNMIINGSQMLVASTGKPATTNNPDALVPSGKTGNSNGSSPSICRKAAARSIATRAGISIPWACWARSSWSHGAPAISARLQQRR